MIYNTEKTFQKFRKQSQALFIGYIIKIILLGGFTTMSDLAATNCGCNNGLAGNNIIFIILILCCCGGNNGILGGNDNCGCDTVVLLVLILCCCGGC